MNAAAKRQTTELPPAPMAPAVVRRLLGWSQVRVAAIAGTGVASVRVFELSPAAITNFATRRALEETYASMRSKLLAR